MHHIINVLGVIKVGSAIRWHKDLQLFGPLSGLHLLRIFYPTLRIQYIFIQSTIAHTLPLVSPIIWINIYMYVFSYLCKMQYLLNLVLEN